MQGPIGRGEGKVGDTRLTPALILQVYRHPSTRYEYGTRTRYSYQEPGSEMHLQTPLGRAAQSEPQPGRTSTAGQARAGRHLVSHFLLSEPETATEASFCIDFVLRTLPTTAYSSRLVAGTKGKYRYLTPMSPVPTGCTCAPGPLIARSQLDLELHHLVKNSRCNVRSQQHAWHKGFDVSCFCHRLSSILVNRGSLDPWPSLIVSHRPVGQRPESSSPRTTLNMQPRSDRAWHVCYTHVLAACSTLTVGSRPFDPISEAVGWQRVSVSALLEGSLVSPFTGWIGTMGDRAGSATAIFQAVTASDEGIPDLKPGAKRPDVYLVPGDVLGQSVGRGVFRSSSREGLEVVDEVEVESSSLPLPLSYIMFIESLPAILGVNKVKGNVGRCGAAAYDSNLLGVSITVKYSKQSCGLDMCVNTNSELGGSRTRANIVIDDKPLPKCDDNAAGSCYHEAEEEEVGQTRHCDQFKQRIKGEQRMDTARPADRMTTVGYLHPSPSRALGNATPSSNLSVARQLHSRGDDAKDSKTEARRELLHRYRSPLSLLHRRWRNGRWKGLSDTIWGQTGKWFNRLGRTLTCVSLFWGLFLRQEHVRGIITDGAERTMVSFAHSETIESGRPWVKHGVKSTSFISLAMADKVKRSLKALVFEPSWLLLGRDHALYSEEPTGIPSEAIYATNFYISLAVMVYLETAPAGQPLKARGLYPRSVVSVPKLAGFHLYSYHLSAPVIGRPLGDTLGILAVAASDMHDEHIHATDLSWSEATGGNVDAVPGPENGSRPETAMCMAQLCMAGLDGAIVSVVGHYDGLLFLRYHYGMLFYWVFLGSHYPKQRSLTSQPAASQVNLQPHKSTCCLSLTLRHRRNRSFAISRHQKHLVDSSQGDESCEDKQLIATDTLMGTIWIHESKLRFMNILQTVQQIVAIGHALVPRGSQTLIACAIWRPWATEPGLFHSSTWLLAFCRPL
ncbi:hypothetical protein HRG_014955 [Hirsutella rhossiliensis]